MENPITETAPRAGKKLTGKFKGLPPWVYVGVIGVGVGVVWYVMHHNQSTAAADAQDQSGINTDPGYSYSTSGGDAFPGGAIGGGATYPYDTSGANNQQPLTADDFISLISTLLPTGGGTQTDVNANDHYIPPSITVNIPSSATPTPVAQSPSAPPHTTSPGPSCPSAFPRHNASAGPPSPKTCYKCDNNTGSDKKKYPKVHVYQDGHHVASTVCD